MGAWRAALVSYHSDCLIVSWGLCIGWAAEMWCALCAYEVWPSICWCIGLTFDLLACVLFLLPLCLTSLSLSSTSPPLLL
jgi:hypothetical protein